MSFLSAPDLSILMQTCRYFLDACLLPLCSYSEVVLLEGYFELVPSFRRFLRIDAGSSSRAHLIKELWIAIGELDPTSPCDPSATLRLSEEWTPALLDVLRHCHNVRRLRLDRWFMKELPYAILIDTIASSMAHLEELTIRAPYGADVDVLCPLARLPLLRLSFLRDPHSSDSRDSPASTPFSLDMLPRSLTELDVDFHGAPISTPFPLVKKLGVRTTGRPIWGTFLAQATTAFPNVTQLIVRQHTSAGVWSLVPHLVEGTRHLSTIQWRSLQAHEAAWSSLSAIWAEDLCLLYALGFPKRVDSLSIPFRRYGEERYTPAMLSDAAPKVLELRVDIDDGFLYHQADWGAHFGPSVSSVVRLTMLHYTGRDHSVKMWQGDLERVKLVSRIHSCCSTTAGTAPADKYTYSSRVVLGAGRPLQNAPRVHAPRVPDDQIHGEVLPARRAHGTPRWARHPLHQGFHAGEVHRPRRAREPYPYVGRARGVRLGLGGLGSHPWVCERSGFDSRRPDVH